MKSTHTIPSRHLSPAVESWRGGLTIRRVSLMLIAAGLAWFAVGTTAQAETGQRIKSASARHNWSAGRWEIRAEPGSVCVAIVQYGLKPDFWGFKQTGPNLNTLELFFDSYGPAQPKTLEMYFNDAQNTMAAHIENWAGLDSYVVSFKPNVMLASFPDRSDFKAVSGNQEIWHVVEFHMHKVEEAMLKCCEWQIDNS
jgi:hypothetical protein